MIFGIITFTSKSIDTYLFSDENENNQGVSAKNTDSSPTNYEDETPIDITSPQESVEVTLPSTLNTETKKF